MSIADQCRNLLREQPWQTGRELAQAIGIKTDTVLSVLRIRTFGPRGARIYFKRDENHRGRYVYALYHETSAPVRSER